MSETTIAAPALTIQTGFKDWRGSPPHLFGTNVGRPLNSWGFADIFASTGFVIVRDDIAEGREGAPYSFKTHAAGQCISRFTTNSNFTQAGDHGVAFNVVMNTVMQGVDAYSHSDFILGTSYYTTWRLRGLTRNRTTGAIFGNVFSGGGIGPNGVSLTSLYVVSSPPVYVLAADFTVGVTNGDRAWQLEVGFGSAANAISTFDTLTASPEWPAFTVSVPESNT